MKQKEIIKRLGKLQADITKRGTDKIDAYDLIQNLSVSYSIDYKTANISNGIYLYKLYSGKYVETKRLLFLK